MADFVNNEYGMYVCHTQHEGTFGALVTGVIWRMYVQQKENYEFLTVNCRITQKFHNWKN